MQNITRRTAIQFISGASVLAPIVLLQESCGNANQILTAINTITNDAQKVITALQGSVCTVAQTSACISQSGYDTVMAWVNELQGANAQALTIDAGAATLTVGQIADISLLYSKVVLQNIPIPANVQQWITIAQQAVQGLLSLLGTAQAAANAASGHVLVLTISWDHLMSARAKNASLKTRLEKAKGAWIAAHAALH